MKLEVFEAIIKTLEHQIDQSVKLAQLGVDVLGYDDAWIAVVKMSLSAYYGTEGGNWIGWYLFERTAYEEPLIAKDKNGKNICYDIPSLWKHVEELRVSNSFKEYELPDETEITEKDLFNLFPEGK